MNRLLATFFFLTIAVHYCLSQDSVVVISARMFDNNHHISLAPANGWIFKQGNDSSWANKQLNTSDWIKLRPTELSAKQADKNGKVEGWFRFKFKVDTDFRDMSLGFKRGGWAATDLYVDGHFLASFGNTGTGGSMYTEYNPIDKPSIQVDLAPNTEHLLALHFVDYVTALPPHYLKSEINGGVRDETKGLPYFIMIAGPQYNLGVPGFSRESLKFRTLWLSVTASLALLFWLLTFLNPQQKKILLLIALCATFSALSNLSRFYMADPQVSFKTFRSYDLLYNLSRWLSFVTIFIITFRVLPLKSLKKLDSSLAVVYILGALMIPFKFFEQFLYIAILAGFILYLFILFYSSNKIKGAQWAIVAGLLATFLSAAVLIALILFDSKFAKNFVLLTAVYLSLPVLLLVYVALRFREIIREVQVNARQLVQMTEERKEQAVKQQKILEEEVARQTSELRNTLDNLKSTQAQLIQSEKMASLGELTAGIAHEIQNPLNFVNNFSEVNGELIDELKNELAIGNTQLANEIANDIKDNEQKINHHGKRADAIVKGMLQHSRASSGQKELTDINALADEYLRLAYHGLRAKDKSFSAKFETDFDKSIGKINVVPQDIGRVMLNLINNAFYAVHEKKNQLDGSYEPMVSVATRKLEGKVEIKVNDNGTGIPQKVLGKIFQPFFTTKPTGEGTGLGLSLSYDIIKAHGGQLRVETKEGQGSEFIIQLQNLSPER